MLFALAAAAMGAGSVHAFEPLARVHGILAGNITLNPGFPIRTWQCAVGPEDGSATIFDPGGDAPTSASLSQEFANDKFGNIKGSDITVRAIDSFCREQGISAIDLIKIDVEGFEEHALRGMQGSVASSRPVILMEVLPGQTPGLRRVVDELWPGVYGWAQIDEGAGNTSRNVLLTPRNDAGGSRA